MARTRAVNAATAALRKKPVSMALAPSRHHFGNSPVVSSNALSIR
jgi:hypothetical protein